jgi:hypothetical protein
MSICPVSGCGELTTGGKCPPHAAAAAARDDVRRHAKQREHGRDTSAWRRLRAARLAFDGHRCQLRMAGCKRQATTVHLDPRLAGRHDVATLADVVSACDRCHGAADAPRAAMSNGGASHTASHASRPVRNQTRPIRDTGCPTGGRA